MANQKFVCSFSINQASNVVNKVLYTNYRNGSFTEESLMSSVVNNLFEIDQFTSAVKSLDTDSLNSYLDAVITEIQLSGSQIQKRVLKQDPSNRKAVTGFVATVNNIALSLSENNEFVNMFNQHIANLDSVEANSDVEVQTENIDAKQNIKDTSYDVNDTNDSNDSEEALPRGLKEKTISEVLEESVGIAKGIKGKMELHKFLTTFFTSGSEHLLENFKGHFINSLYNNWIQTSGYGNIFTVDEAVNNYKSSLKENQSKFAAVVGNKTLTELVDSDNEELFKNYFDLIISQYKGMDVDNVDSLLGFFFPAIKKNGQGYFVNSDSDSVRTDWVESDAFHMGLDSSAALSLHISATPLVKIENSALGLVVKPNTDGKTEFLTKNHIGNVVNILKKLKNDSTLPSELLRLAKSDANYSFVFASLYYRFFHDAPYDVNGTQQQSISTLESRNPENNSLITGQMKSYLMSMDERTFTSVQNGKVIVAGGGKDGSFYNTLKNDFNNRLAKTGVMALKDNIRDIITFELEDREGTDYKMKMSFNNGETVLYIKPATVNGDKVNGLVTTDGVLSVDQVSGILSKLKISDNNRNKVLFNKYNEITQSNTDTTKDLSLTNFVANFLYGIALNNSQDVREQLAINKFIIPKQNTDADNRLLYPPLDYMPEFLFKLASADEMVTGFDKPQVVMNLDNDRVGHISGRSWASEINSLITDLRKDAGRVDRKVKHILSSNPLAKDTLAISGWVGKDGFKDGDNRITNSSFSDQDHYTFLMGMYANEGIKSNFKRILLQPVTWSDKKDSKMARYLYKGSNNFCDPGNLKSSTEKGFESIEKGAVAVIKQERDYHNNLCANVLTTWNNEIQRWNNDGSISEEQYKSLSEATTYSEGKYNDLDLKS